jgi:hypothetical protein
MRTGNLFLYAILACSASAFGQTLHTDQEAQIAAKLPLDVSVERFDVTDAIMRSGLSELSLKHISDLHLGFEEIIREKIQDDPRVTSPHFSIHLRHKSVREVLDELCKADFRYAWSADGNTINVYPRATANERSYLLNLWIDKISVNDIPDPDQALMPLSRLFPSQQLGYAGPGLGDNTYAKPWTAVFDSLTVRQFINRLAEHMGSQTSWVWRGGENERLFTFLKGGFHMLYPSDQQ